MGNRRAIQADATRADIVSAARELFLARGYVRSSVNAVAEQAGVAVQTIYNSVGNKSALLAAVLDETMAGPGAPRSAGEFMQERAGASGGGIAGLSALLADWIADVNERSTEILTLIQQTAAVYPEVAALERERAERRRAGFVRAASVARTRGGLAGVSDEQAAAAIWSLGHPLVFRSLVVDGDWSAEAYRQWLAQSLRGVLS